MSYNNGMVAHIWANRSKPSARSSNGNFWFEGDTIYSYRTPIAKLYPGCALVSSAGYSSTTRGKHLPAIRRALSCQSFTVPSIGARGGMNNGSDKIDHAENLEHFEKGFQSAVKSWERARDGGCMIYNSALAAGIADTMSEYAATFHLKAKRWFTPSADFHKTRETVLAKRAANDTPEKHARRERDRAKREAARARKLELLAQKERECQAEWLAGGPVQFRTAYGVPAILRVAGDELQTSQGATVPLDHAIRAFRFILACKDAGRAWEKNGHRIAVGHFEIDSINAGGDIVAGCHHIQWSEIERIAKQLKIIEE